MWQTNGARAVDVCGSESASAAQRTGIHNSGGRCFVCNLVGFELQNVAASTGDESKIARSVNRERGTDREEERDRRGVCLS